MPVRRFDASSVTKYEETPQGYLKVTAPITRAGIFEYRRGDGSIVRELRKPEQVFHGDSLRTFDGAPLVNTEERFPGVPPGHSPMLTPENTAKFMKGMVMSPAQDGTHLTATILVTDASTIAAIKAGKRELSCGYSCDVVAESGEWDGQRYDAVQENIVGNHVALVSKGRAGSTVSIRLDSADAELVASDSTAVPKERRMKLKFDAAEVEVEESLAALIQADRAKAEAALKAQEALVEKQAARGDSAEADAKKAREELAAAPAKIRAQVQEELALHGRAAKVLGSEAKFYGMDVPAVQQAVLAKLGVKVEGKSAEYVAARFDAELERFEAGAKPAEKTEEIKGDALDALEAAKAKMNAASRDAYKNGKA